jgi:hypothetical protein
MQVNINNRFSDNSFANHHSIGSRGDNLALNLSRTVSNETSVVRSRMQIDSTRLTERMLVGGD